jgi:hypothetical protein
MFYVLVGGLCSISRPLVVSHGRPFSPHFKIGISLMDPIECPLILVTLHHVSHL